VWRAPASASEQTLAMSANRSALASRSVSRYCSVMPLVTVMVTATATKTT